jgi:hypothetical protein
MSPRACGTLLCEYARTGSGETFMRCFSRFIANVALRSRFFCDWPLSGVRDGRTAGNGVLRAEPSPEVSNLFSDIYRFLINSQVLVSSFAW